MKISIKVLGTGCNKCKSLEEAVLQVVKENNIEAEVIKVEDIVEIMKYGIMTTPALVVNEKTIFSGKVPSKSELKTCILNAIHE